MLHAAAMLLGLTLIWFVATAGAPNLVDIAAAAGAALACTLLAARAGGAGASFARAPRAALVTLSRLPVVFGGALATLRAAISADVTLRPALVRIKSRGGGAARAAFANVLSSAPGMVVVETDSDGFLVHVLDEEGVDASALGELERIVGAQEGR
ncbi:MAG TPA: Na+/H+ antiporter subunit E [Vitreimonas sp.]|uniref:Na+/H+ antiporter subunit E n=1 Tax=Vitreimonas sp. TaxID=3069702 RepID=UPI002D624C96|nr:Na+/H+ antiporter subunit E [Vitreimonas sp.]HYD89155.1 Na+/H+ antiporter subunit E [Vitreimonas sp.]